MGPGEQIVPSGRQSVLCASGQRLVAVEVGGGLRRYQVGGVDVLDGYQLDETCTSGRGQLLIPWPNRLAGGSYEEGGVSHQLALTEPDAGNAIHGLTRFANWEVAEQTPGGVSLRHRLHPQPGYPWALDTRVDYRLDADGLTVTMSATNRSSTACPYGCGAHPYLRLGDGLVDSLVLTAPAATRYQSDAGGIPTGTAPVEGTQYDFRAPRPIEDTKLDTAFTDLQRDSDGRAVVELADGRGRTLRLWLGAGFDYLMLFSGDSIPDPSRRRRGLGVEPMTCAPNAFRNGDGLQMLPPGQTSSASWGITAGW